jgi:hypothetical protein
VDRSCEIQEKKRHSDEEQGRQNDSDFSQHNYLGVDMQI